MSAVEGLEAGSLLRTDDRDLAVRVARLLIEDGDPVTVVPAATSGSETEWVVAVGEWE